MVTVTIFLSVYVYLTRRSVKWCTHTTTGVLRESSRSRALREVGRHVRISVLYANNISVVWHLSSLCSVYACVWACVCVLKPLIRRIFVTRTFNRLARCDTRTHTRNRLFSIFSVPSHFSLSILFSFPPLGVSYSLLYTLKRPHAISLSVRHAGPTSPVNLHPVYTHVHTRIITQPNERVTT